MKSILFIKNGRCYSIYHIPRFIVSSSFRFTIYLTWTIALIQFLYILLFYFFVSIDVILRYIHQIFRLVISSYEIVYTQRRKKKLLFVYIEVCWMWWISVHIFWRKKKLDEFNMLRFLFILLMFLFLVCQIFIHN